MRLVLWMGGLLCAFGASAAAQTPSVADQPAYVFSSWQAGAVGTCFITEKHITADCDVEPGPNGDRAPPEYVELLLNHQAVPGLPVGRRVTVMIKLREPVQGLPPDRADAAITEIHLHDLQRKYYPRAALAAKLEGKASADCTVRENGQLDICWITDETPVGAGFGEATLSVINLMTLASPLPADRKQRFELSWRYPGPAEQVFVNCLMTPDSRTSDCKTDRDPDYPGAAQAVLNALSAQPLLLAGAPAGQRIDIALLRSELGKPQIAGGQEPVSAPYRPVRLTALRADDILYYYPSISIRLGEAGFTDVRCKVTDDGRLNECWVSNNQANSVRLARAHLLLTEIVRMQPPAADAPAYDRRVYAFRVAWSLRR